MMEGRAVGIQLLGAAVLLAACSSAFLEIAVSNDSAEDAELQLASGIEGDPDRQPFVHYTDTVAAGASETISVEPPGPDEWTLYVDGVPLTDSLHWPSDNPTLDFQVVIHPDGTAELRNE